MKRLLFAAALTLFGASISLAGEPSVEVAAIATSVEKLIPIGVSDKFSSTVGRPYCYSKIIGGDGQNIRHVWYLNEKRFSESVLSIKSKSYRTFSGATIRMEMRGKGRVDITTEDGKVLKSVDFEIE